jgi:hypothetical protein
LWGNTMGNDAIGTNGTYPSKTRDLCSDLLANDRRA